MIAFNVGKGGSNGFDRRLMGAAPDRNSHRFDRLLQSSLAKVGFSS